MGIDHAIAGFLNGDDSHGSKCSYSFAIDLLEGAPNELQGATLTFDIQMDAVQAANNTPHISYQGFGGTALNISASEQANINW